MVFTSCVAMTVPLDHEPWFQ